jgi:predicted RND superfamily exporter protein
MRPVSEKPPFDPLRASFYLVAAILAFQCVVVGVGLAHCVYWSERIVEGKYQCDNINATLNQLLSAALAAALAFTAGFTKRDK